MMIGSFKVPGSYQMRIGFDLNVTLSMDMPADDLSGNTSLTEKADKGVKPKKLVGAFSIRETQTEMSYLTEFLNLAEAKSGTGDAVPYVVVHPLAQASRIRQMRFVGNVSVREHETMKQYDVSFTLEEVRSVPEAKEKREQSRKAGGQPKESFTAALEKIEAQVTS